MSTSTNALPAPQIRLLRAGLLAGLAGGLAEVVWISLFAGLTGGSAAEVATGVTATFMPDVTASAGVILLGLAIHFGLAAALGIAVAVVIRQVAPKLAGSLTESALIIAALAGVWSMNFLVILPIVNPAFVHIVPMPVSFASKMLFGVATALALRMVTDKKEAAKSEM